MISTKLVILFVLGFLLVLAISLFAGTREYNYYCFEVQRGNPRQVYFRGAGDGLGGFTNCVINTPTLNPFILLLGAYVVLFILHVYLISQLGQRKIVKNVVNVFIFAILLLSFSYLSGSFFQHIWHGFLEGGIWLEQGGWQLISFFTPWSQPRQFLYIYPQFLLLMFFCFLISQSGPMIITFLLNRFRLSYGYKPGIKSFLYVLVAAGLFQLLIVAILFNLFWFRRIFYSMTPEVVGWKRYQNEKYQFELQYPESWLVKESKRSWDAEAGLFPYFRFQNKEKVEFIKGSHYVHHGSVFEIILHQASDFTPPARNLETLNINGMIAKCYLPSNYGPPFDCWIWVNRDDYFFRLAGYVTNEKERTNNSHVLKRMLSSFKYTEPGFVQGAPPTPKECYVVIRLYDKQGNPYGQKWVRIHEGVELVFERWIDQDGKFSLKLAPGEYELEMDLGNNNFVNTIFNVKENPQVINLVL